MTNQTKNRFLQIRATRKQELQYALQQNLEVYYYPRLLMLSLIITMALIAFLLSFGLRLAGVTDLALRYLLVWIVVYLSFIGLMRLWAGWQLSNKENSFDIDVSNLIPDGDSFSSGGGAACDYAGSGGNFSESGAKGSWSDSSSNCSFSGSSSKSFSSSSSHSSGSSSSSSNALLDAVDVDVGEAGLPIVIILAILAVVASMLGGLVWMAYSLVDTAPILLAELLAEVMIINGLGRRLQIVSLDDEHWFFTIWKRTQKFFWMIVGLIGVLFLSLHFGHIQVQTLGELFRLL